MDVVNPNQAQITIAPFVTLFLVVFVLQLTNKRNAIKRCPLLASHSLATAQIWPGIATFLLAGSVVALSFCKNTAAEDTCSLSIALKDEFGDLTSVARIGGTLHVFCEGGSRGSMKSLQSRKTNQGVPAIVEGRDEMSIKIIWSNSNDWKSQKYVFTNLIKCNCGSVSSRFGIVPLPILCSADSQLTCGGGEICSVNADTGKEECTDAKSNCKCGTARVKTTTFLCPREDGEVPLEECRDIPDLWSGTGWPEFEVPKKDKKMCHG